MPRSSSPQAATRFAIPRTLVAGFVVAALATLVIAIVNFRSAEARADAVHANARGYAQFARSVQGTAPFTLVVGNAANANNAVIADNDSSPMMKPSVAAGISR